MSTPEPLDERAWHRFGEGSSERAMLIALGVELGVELRPRGLTVGDGTRIEIEGTDPDGSVLVQLVANQGSFKSQHRNKAMADMFKLVWLRDTLFTGSRTILCISETVSAAFNPSGWTIVAAREMGVEVMVYAEGPAGSPGSVRPLPG